MEANQVTLKETHHDIMSVNLHSEDIRSREGRVEEEADIGLRISLLHIERQEQKFNVMDPNLTHFIVFRHLLDLDDFLRELLI